MGSESVEDPEYLKSRLKVLKWNPATKKKRGSWEPVPDEAIVLDPEQNEVIVPADDVTTYVIVSEQTPPSIVEKQPGEGASVREMRPIISAKIVDKGTGVARGAENRIILRLDGENIPLGKANLSEGDPTEMSLTWQPEKELAPGEHIIQIEAEDIVGNRRVAKWRFKVDNRPPYIEKFRVGSTGLVLAQAKDPGGSIDPEKSQIKAGQRTIPMNYAAPMQQFVARLDGLPDGEHQIEIEVRDRGGKRARDSSQYHRDTKPPKLQDKRPKQRGPHFADSKEDIQIIAKDPSKVDLRKLHLYLDGRKIAKAGDKNTQGGWIYDSQNEEIHFPLPKDTEEGRHQLYIALADRKGNHQELTVEFQLFKEHPKVRYDQKHSIRDKGAIIARTDKAGYIDKIKVLQNNIELPAILDTVTGAILLPTTQDSPIELQIKDKAGGQLQSILDPSKNQVQNKYQSSQELEAYKYLSRSKSKILWAINLALILAIGAIFYMHRRKYRAASAGNAGEGSEAGDAIEAAETHDTNSSSEARAAGDEEEAGDDADNGDSGASRDTVEASQGRDDSDG